MKFLIPSLEQPDALKALKNRIKQLEKKRLEEDCY